MPEDFISEMERFARANRYDYELTTNIDIHTPHQILISTKDRISRKDKFVGIAVTDNGNNMLSLYDGLTLMTNNKSFFMETLQGIRNFSLDSRVLDLWKVSFVLIKDIDAMKHAAVYLEKEKQGYINKHLTVFTGQEDFSKSKSDSALGYDYNNNKESYFIGRSVIFEDRTRKIVTLFHSDNRLVSVVPQTSFHPTEHQYW